MRSRRTRNDVTLRDVRASDLPIFFQQQLDPEAIRMAAFPPRDRDSFMAHWSTNVLSDSAVTVRTVLFDGKVAGNVVSFERHGLREVGYWIGREFWGKGVATGALSGFLDHDAARPLFARVAEQNVASVRVLEKCGFRRSERDPGPPGDDGVVEHLYELNQ